MTHIEQLAQAIADGHNDATLIEWAAADLFGAEVTPAASIEASKAQAAAAEQTSAYLFAMGENDMQLEADLEAEQAS